MNLNFMSDSNLVKEIFRIKIVNSFSKKCLSKNLQIRVWIQPSVIHFRGYFCSLVEFVEDVSALRPFEFQLQDIHIETVSPRKPNHKSRLQIFTQSINLKVFKMHALILIPIKH